MNEQDVFVEAVQISNATDRDAFLDRVCKADSPLRRRIGELLAAHGRAGSFLQQPIAVSDPEETSGYLSDVSVVAVGTTVGPFKLLEVIGEGGMGIVYMAEQTTPIRRRVAFKIIKPGMDSKQVAARFESERQALALMDHPHIARVFDGGATESGRPYFVMELVRGLPVTEYCDQHRLSVPERLGLFVQICRAVQHAHQKGIIHRDLKPSNVLATVIDGVPVPKVIDFGIAKATGGALTDRTLFTGFQQLIGTPLYMSPEQAELSGVDVDTRSDVYSLGVLLYELLTGTTPFDPETFRKSGFDEMRRMIREDEPDRPSRRVSTLAAEQCSTVADRRRADIRQLRRLMRSELDWVVMRALEKNRNRRYDGAGSLAADVERYLANVPVYAAPPSMGYRVRKFVRRNRGRLTVAAVIFIALAGVSASLGWALLDRTNRRAQEQQQHAMRLVAVEQSAMTALAESADRFTHSQPEAAMASAVKAVEMLASISGAERLWEESRQRVADLAMASRLENVWLEDVEERLSISEQADEMGKIFAEYGLEIPNHTADETIAKIKGGLIAGDLAAGMDRWASLQRLVNGPADPLANKLRAIATAIDPDPWGRRARDVTLDGTAEQIVALAEELPVTVVAESTVARIGNALAKAGCPVEAERLWRRAAQAHPEHVKPVFSLGKFLRHSSSESTRVEALGYYRSALALRPHNAEIRNHIGICLTDCLKRPAEGETVFREVIRMQPNHRSAWNNIPVSLLRQGKAKDAIAAAREAVAIAPGVVSYNRLAAILHEVGQLQEAVEASRTAVSYQPITSLDHLVRGDSFSRMGRPTEAIAAYRDAVRLYPASESAFVQYRLGKELTRIGKLDEALAAFQTALKFRPHYAAAVHDIGLIHTRRQQFENAVDYYQKAASLEPTHSEYQRSVGVGLYRLGRWDGAVKAYQESIRLKPDNADAHYNLGAAFKNLDQTNQAIEAYRNAIHYRPNFAEAYCNLAQQLRKQGHYAESLKMYRKGHELGKNKAGWSYPSDRWVEEAERLHALEMQIPQILHGTVKLKDASDMILIAKLAAERKRFHRSVVLYRSAFEADPRLTDSRIGRRYSAACSAARAGCGQGEDSLTLSESERMECRQFAREWLRADLAHWEGLAGGSAKEKTDTLTKLSDWSTDTDLAGVREVSRLAMLTAAERIEWEKFWAEVKAVLDKAGKPAI